MKKVLVLGALCALVTGASAQVKAYKADQMTNPNSVAYALPRTVVKVRVVAEKESVRVGPYARFAQKYLGVIAPLADKDIYTIKSATLCGAQEADPAEVYVLEKSGADLRSDSRRIRCGPAGRRGTGRHRRPDT